MSDTYLDLLLKFNGLPPEIHDPSIFDIAGYPHYENVCSNVLAFYFDPQREHGLGNLLLASLMDAAEVPFEDIRDVKVQREYPTVSGGRLDLLITSSSHVIGIENKIFHHLANDLGDYGNTIQYGAGARTTVRIVLSPRRVMNIPHGSQFKNITYGQFWDKVRSGLGFHAATASEKWLAYLLDFINTTLRFSEKRMDLTESDRFFITHDKQLEALTKSYSNFLARLDGEVNLLNGFINSIDWPQQVAKRRVSSSDCLRQELTLPGHNVVFELYIGPRGWTFHIFAGDKASRDLVSRVAQNEPSELHFEKNRFIADETWPLSLSLHEVAKRLREWIDLTIATASDDMPSHFPTPER